MSNIVACGIPRSGSTLVWQILRAVFPDQTILKTHPAYTEWDRKGKKILVSIRDPRDVAASLYRVRLSRGPAEAGGPEGMEQVLNRTLMYFEAAEKLPEHSSLFVRYEQFVYNFNVLFDAIEKLDGRRISTCDKIRIQRKYCLTLNKIRARKLKNFNEVDEEGIHGDHIGPVHPGSWQQAPPWAVHMITSKINPILERWGYEI